MKVNFLTQSEAYNLAKSITGNRPVNYGINVNGYSWKFKFGVGGMDVLVKAGLEKVFGGVDNVKISSPKKSGQVTVKFTDRTGWMFVDDEVDMKKVLKVACSFGDI